jgi:hypothetical protein
MLGAYKPLRVYLLIYQVARDTADPRAGEILAAARRIIEKRAALILDPSIRQSYLTHVPENRLLDGSLTVQPFNNP